MNNKELNVKKEILNTVQEEKWWMSLELCCGEGLSEQDAKSGGHKRKEWEVKTYEINKFCMEGWKTKEKSVNTLAFHITCRRAIYSTRTSGWNKRPAH